MAIVRKEKFIVVPEKTIKDKRLSYTELGLLVKLLYCSEYDTEKRNLDKDAIKDNIIYSGLIKKGYIDVQTENGETIIKVSDKII